MRSTRSITRNRTSPLSMDRTARASRRQKGVLASILYVMGVLIMFMLCALGTDVSHIVSVRAQMRNAADAAALAGAADLHDAIDDCERHAHAVAELNLADGIPVSNNSEPVTVTTTVVPPDVNQMGSVTVNVKLALSNLVAPVFNHFFSLLDVTAVAGGCGKVVKMPSNSVFPLAPSIDTIIRYDGVDQTPLMNRRIGDVHKLYINSQQVKNAAFTSLTEKNTNANWVREAISQCLGISPAQPGFIPSVAVGEEIYLSNGVIGEKILADDPYFSELVAPGRTLWLPIIKGDPPYNQHRTCIGFMNVKVLNVEKNLGNGLVEVITVRLQSSMVDGIGGDIPSTGNGAIDTALDHLAPCVVKLIK